MNEGSLANMSDRDLAVFQSKYPEEAPQSRLALHEWNRRLVVAQLKESRFATIVALVGTLAGTILGAILGKWLG
jgi:hypothetical protein